MHIHWAIAALLVAAPGSPAAHIDVHKEAPCRGSAFPPNIPLDAFWFVFFDRDSAAISRQTALILDNAIAAWRELPPECPIEVAGYTDTAGSAEHNLALSRRRAEAVAAYLRRHGVDSEIRTTSHGETQLFVETPDGVREPENRRAVVMVVPNP